MITLSGPDCYFKNFPSKALKHSELHFFLPCRACWRIWRLRVEENFLESLKDCDGVGEYPVGEEEGVEEVDVQETKVRQTLKETLRRCVPDLRNLKIKSNFLCFSRRVVCFTGLCR